MDSLKEKLTKQLTSWESERSSFMGQWQEISRFIQPRLGRFATTDNNQGTRRDGSIINSTGTRALRVGTSGMFTGIMSPSRPWFALKTPDPEMMEYEPVKIWLYEIEGIIRDIFNESNLYNMAPTVVQSLLAHGTGVMTHVDNFDNVARFYAIPTGSYCLAQDADYKKNSMSRKFTMTVRNMVKQFGYEALSRGAKQAWDSGNYETKIEVVHIIQPNDNFDPNIMRSEAKRFMSVHYETGSDDRTKLLRHSGYDDLPFYAPCWETTGEDIYGTNCPGMVALGDVKGLQLMEKRKAQAIDKMVSPPLRGPGSLKNTTVSSLPGGVTLYQAEGEHKLEPIYSVQPRIQELAVDIQNYENRIRETFYNDLFRAILDMQGIQPKNQLEISQRKEESLLELGPVLEQAHQSWLSPMIDRTFKQALKAGILPDPPPELAGVHLGVKYISSLAVAQRSVATGGIDRFAGFVSGLAATGLTGALDKLDVDDAVDEYARLIQVPPKIVRSTEEAVAMRTEKARQQQAAVNTELGQGVASAAKDLRVALAPPGTA